jgi:hypothetical protein
VLGQSVATALATSLTLLPELPTAEIDVLLDEVEGELARPEVPASRRDTVMLDVLITRATASAREGASSEGERLYRRYLDLHPPEEPSALAFYSRARILSLLGRRSEALAALAEAGRGGFSEFPPESDPALVALRGSSEYRSLVRDYRRPWIGSGTD